MLLADQQHRQGRVVVQQVEEAQPLEPQNFHRRAGQGVIAVVAVPPTDVLVAEQLTGPVAKLFAGFADHFDDAAPHPVDGISSVTPGKHLGAGGEGEHLAIHLSCHQLDRSVDRWGYHHALHPPSKPVDSCLQPCPCLAPRTTAQKQAIFDKLHICFSFRPVPTPG